MDDDTKNRLTRRKFIKVVGGSAVTLGAAGCLPDVDGGWDSCEEGEPYENLTPQSHRVVEVVSADSVDPGAGTIDGQIVAQMFTAGLLALTGHETLLDAWNQVMPERKSGKRVALKVNALNPDVPTSPEALKAIIDSLMDDFQVSMPDIFVWDRTHRELERAGLTPERLGVSCRGTVYSATDFAGPGYDPESACLSGRKISLSSVLTREVDHLINVPVMKNHFAAAFSGSLKNHYGSFSAPFDFHKRFEQHIARLNTLPQIASVSRLHVMDALFGVCLGDTDKPADCAPGRMLLSFDPVAIDQRGLEIRDEMRDLQGQGPGNPAGYLQEAEALGLGTTAYQLVTIEL
jgi:uncharacterized protein (DUF362 family)